MSNLLSLLCDALRSCVVIFGDILLPRLDNVLDVLIVHEMKNKSSYELQFLS